VCKISPCKFIVLGWVPALYLPDCFFAVSLRWNCIVWRISSSFNATFSLIRYIRLLFWKTWTWQYGYGSCYRRMRIYSFKNIHFPPINLNNANIFDRRQKRQSGELSGDWSPQTKEEEEKIYIFIYSHHKVFIWKIFCL